MPLISLKNVSLAYGLNPLLDNVNFQINKGERVCLIGRNGEGKSSLLKVISGQEVADSGEVWKDSGVKVAMLSQVVPESLDATVYDIVSAGLGEAGEKLAQFHHLLTKHDEKSMQRLADIQHELDAIGAWSFEQKITTVLTRLNLPADAKLSELSGGWIRRVLLGQALVAEPDLLLLDEPTNHLDIDAIEWLEEALIQNFNGGVLFVTHDRAFLERLATKIIWLDRGNLSEFPGDYQNYLRRKAEMENAENLATRQFDKKLAEEEVWIRKGIQARRTRNEGRVRALEQLRRERKARINKQGTANLQFEQAGLSGKKVVEATNITYHIENKKLIENFSITIHRSDRIGLVGPNGIGKSTLLKLLLGQLQPQSGKLEIGTKLEVAYFDQLRSALDLEKTVMDNIGEGKEVIEVNGKSFHIMSWLQEFMFSPQRARTPVKSLSGGERNRLLLAKLFTSSANVLVLDEPTNDLDIETLEMLEELLAKFTGTLLIVSHDRAFLDQVVTSILVFEGNGVISEHVGGYQDWAEKKKTQVTGDKAAIKSDAKSANKATHKAESKPEVKPETKIADTKETSKSTRRLSYNESRELAGLPDKLALLEQEIAELTNKTQDPEFYKLDFAAQSVVLEALTKKNNELEIAFERWAVLDAIQG